MDAVRSGAADQASATFEDGLGTRYRLTDASGAGAEVLVVREELTSVSSFEFALRERAGRLASFRHSSFMRVRSIDRSTFADPGVRIVSDPGDGLRLSSLLAEADRRRVPIDINASLCLVRQLVPAVAMLHETARDVAHGALGPERLVVTPNARLQIVEYVLGAALEQLRFTRERYWTDLRIALPAGPGAPRFDHRADVLQVGVVALSLILGRVLRDDEFPARVGDIVASTWAVSPRGGFEPLPPGLRGWLGRALQLDPARSFASAVEAREDLEAVLGDSDTLASPASLDAFLTRFHAAAPPAPPAAARVASPPPVPQVPVAPPPPAPPAPVAQEAPVELDREPAGAPSVASTAGTLEELHRLLSPAAAAVVPAAADVHRDSASADRPPGDDEWVADIAEGEDPAHERSRAPWWRDWRVGGVAAALLVVVAAGGTLGARRTPSRASVAPQSGTLEISSNPAGVETFVDGDLRGTTPLVLALDPGMHTVELRGAGDPRTIPITINAGMKVSQYVELSRGGARTAATKPASVAPVPDLVVAPPPSLPPAPAVPAAGWVTVKGASDVQVYEGGAALGSARDRLALSPGRHQLEFRNDELGIHSAAVVQISSGKVSSVDVAVPNGTLSLNALPWAEVWIDGEKAGETPLGNMTLPVGAHDIVFRHPELGERHQMVTVTRSETRRVSVDLNRP